MYTNMYLRGLQLAMVCAIFLAFLTQGATGGRPHTYKLVIEKTITTTSTTTTTRTTWSNVWAKASARHRGAHAWASQAGYYGGMEDREGAAHVALSSRGGKTVYQPSNATSNGTVNSTITSSVASIPFPSLATNPTTPANLTTLSPPTASPPVSSDAAIEEGIYLAVVSIFEDNPMCPANWTAHVPVSKGGAVNDTATSAMIDCTPTSTTPSMATVAISIMTGEDSKPAALMFFENDQPVCPANFTITSSSIKEGSMANTTAMEASSPATVGSEVVTVGDTYWAIVTGVFEDDATCPINYTVGYMPVKESSLGDHPPITSSASAATPPAGSGTSDEQGTCGAVVIGGFLEGAMCPINWTTAVTPANEGSTVIDKAVDNRTDNQPLTKPHQPPSHRQTPVKDQESVKSLALDLFFLWRRFCRALPRRLWSCTYLLLLCFGLWCRYRASRRKADKGRRAGGAKAEAPPTPTTAPPSPVPHNKSETLAKLQEAIAFVKAKAAIQQRDHEALLEKRAKEHKEVEEDMEREIRRLTRNTQENKRGLQFFKHTTMRCKPLKMLGSGGQGRVYAFWDRDANAEVALKIGDGFQNHTREEVDAEVRALQRVKGQSWAVQIINSYINEDGWAITMERLQGCDLHDKFVTLEYKGTSVFRRALCDAQVCMLRWLVRNGMIHRDWKPDNLFVLDDGSFKLLDFGLAYFVEGRKRKALVGTRFWMAPEVLLCELHESFESSAVDCWGVGAVMFFTLLGTLYSDATRALIQEICSKPFIAREPFLPQLEALLTRDVADALKALEGQWVVGAMDTVTYIYTRGFLSLDPEERLRTLHLTPKALASQVNALDAQAEALRMDVLRSLEQNHEEKEEEEEHDGSLTIRTHVGRPPVSPLLLSGPPPGLSEPSPAPAPGGVPPPPGLEDASQWLAAPLPVAPLLFGPPPGLENPTCWAVAPCHGDEPPELALPPPALPLSFPIFLSLLGCSPLPLGTAPPPGLSSPLPVMGPPPGFAPLEDDKAQAGGMLAAPGY